MRGGIHLKDNKSISRKIKSNDIVFPEMAFICLKSHIGVAAIAVVEKGSEVKCGTLIAKAQDGISANVFSSICGTVEEIAEFDGKPYIVIKNNGKKQNKDLPKLNELNKTLILKRIGDAGIIGLSGSGFPTHLKLSPTVPVNTLIINGCECEDYLTCDDMLMCNYATEVLNGAALIAKVLGLKTFFVGVEDNKIEAINKLREVAGKVESATPIIVKLKSKYPLGAEKMLINEITKRKVPVGGLPSDVGVIVNNVATCYAVYDACVNNKPLTQKLMTVSGLGVKEQCNIWVKNGATVGDLLEAVGGENYEIEKDLAFSIKVRSLRDNANGTIDKKEKTNIENEIKLLCKSHNAEQEFQISQIIVGGLMMGNSATNLRVPLDSKTGGVLFLTKKEYKKTEESPCINCKKCIHVCPMRLKPVDIYKTFKKNDFESCKSFDPKACFECGCCSFICPAKIELMQTVIKAKRLK